MNQAMRILSISSLMLAIASPAANAAILTVSDLSLQGVGVGDWTVQLPLGVETGTQTQWLNTNWFDEKTISTKEDPAPTTTSQGILKTYETHVEGYNSVRITRSEDYMDLTGSGPGTVFEGGKYVLASMTLRSATDTHLYFQITGRGSYLPVSTPFGPTAPDVASLYSGAATNRSRRLSSGFQVWQDVEGYSINGSTGIDLVANVDTSFVAALYAPNGLAISSFDLYLYSDVYNQSREDVRVVTGTTTALIAAVSVPPLSAPLPAGVWLAGSALAALVTRRRRVA